MRYRDELTGAGCEALPAQMRDAVLGDDVVHVVFTRGADRAGREARADLAYRALGGRCKGDEALAAAGLAPRTKSIWPPEPDMCFVPMLSAQT